MKSGFLTKLLAIAAIALFCTFGVMQPVQAKLFKPSEVSTKEAREKLNAGLTGQYGQDIKSVIESLRFAVQLPADAPNLNQAQTDAKFKINAFAARYRRDKEVGGLRSYTTLRTALNNLGSYYTRSTKRVVPQKVRDRVLVELDRVEQALAQGD
jgi:photosystem II Psb27 protein